MKTFAKLWLYSLTALTLLYVAYNIVLYVIRDWLGALIQFGILLVFVVTLFCFIYHLETSDKD